MLQLLWLMAFAAKRRLQRLDCYAVSCTEQSPRPSHTLWLMNRQRSGSGIRCACGGGVFSDAHVARKRWHSRRVPPQHALHCVQFSSRWWTSTPSANSGDHANVARIVRHRRDALSAFGLQLPRHPRWLDQALGSLPTCHRDRIVVEDLCRLCCSSRPRPHRSQQAGMLIGSVAQVLEHVIHVRKGAAHSLRAFTATSD